MRTAVGAASWLAPRPAGQMFGLNASENPQAPYLARLFGVRDIALGVGLATAPPAARRQWLAIGLACDVADFLAGIAGTKAGYLSKTSGTLVSGAALGGVTLGVLALRHVERGELLAADT
ncbi:MAG TPA: hypothetical protein VGG08_02045 [Solirubrobacteraceae bacterium]